MGMRSIFVIFAIISLLFTAAIHSSSKSFVFAADRNQTDCSYTKDKKTAFCTVGDDDTVWRCDKNKDGKTWRCEALPTEASADVPTDLKNASTKGQLDLPKVVNSYKVVKQKVMIILLKHKLQHLMLQAQCQFHIL
ncbi:MAG TPA: hypothetical protein VJ599_00630 [Nitrososphaeraceae archaeon]|nr:hypothetical protein [Nitrososphaeraceae archaeon]